MRQCRPISTGKCQRPSDGPNDLILTESDFINTWTAVHPIGPNPPTSYSEIQDYQKVLDDDISALDPTDPRLETKKLQRARTDELLVALDKVYDSVLRTDRDWESARNFVTKIIKPEQTGEILNPDGHQLAVSEFCGLHVNQSIQLSRAGIIENSGYAKSRTIDGEYINFVAISYAPAVISNIWVERTQFFIMSNKPAEIWMVIPKPIKRSTCRALLDSVLVSSGGEASSCDEYFSRAQ